MMRKRVCSLSIYVLLVEIGIRIKYAVNSEMTLLPLCAIIANAYVAMRYEAEAAAAAVVVAAQAAVFKM